MPGQHPVVNVHVLVQVAHNDQHRRYCVQDAEYADTDHELLQLVSLGAVMLHNGANAKQGDETREQKHKPEDEVDAQGNDDKVPQGLTIPDPYVANASQNVTCNTRNKSDIRTQIIW